MKRTHRSDVAAIKAKVALTALNGEKTIAFLVSGQCYSHRLVRQFSVPLRLLPAIPASTWRGLLAVVNRPAQSA